MACQLREEDRLLTTTKGPQEWYTVHVKQVAGHEIPIWANVRGTLTSFDSMLAH